MERRKGINGALVEREHKNKQRVREGKGVLKKVMPKRNKVRWVVVVALKKLH